MEKLKGIAKFFAQWDADLYYVGGYCRDLIMGNPSDDIDVCIVGITTAKEVQLILENLKIIGGIDELTSVHGDFPIWILGIGEEKYEFAMARKERKKGLTRQEFECDVNNVTIEEDLERRDFTINAIAKHITTGRIVDPFNGREHIKLKVIEPVSKAFKEDSLRVYRGARFAARFQFAVSASFLVYAQSLVPDDISNERVGMELMKTFKQASKPSIFFDILRDCRWLGYHFVELENCINIPQNPEFHPEGDVYTHTLHCIDAAQDWFTRGVMLGHDLGKVSTTTISPTGKIQAIGHEEASVELARTMLKRIHFCDHKTISQMCCLIRLHMLRAVMNERNKEKMVRRTLRELMNYSLDYMQLANVVWCDLAGRPPKEPLLRILVWKELGGAIALRLDKNNEMDPIVRGTDLLALGLPADKTMGEILRKALELQDRGTLNKDNWRERLIGCGYKQLKIKNNECKGS